MTAHPNFQLSKRYLVPVMRKTGILPQKSTFTQIKKILPKFTSQFFDIMLVLTWPTRTAVSVKTLSHSFENATNVFAGAENPFKILRSKSYIRNSQKLLNFVKIFSEKKTFYGDSGLWVCPLSIPAWLIDDKVISSIPFIINNLHSNQQKFN